MLSHLSSSSSEAARKAVERVGESYGQRFVYFAKQSDANSSSTRNVDLPVRSFWMTDLTRISLSRQEDCRLRSPTTQSGRFARSNESQTTGKHLTESHTREGANVCYHCIIVGAVGSVNECFVQTSIVTAASAAFDKQHDTINSMHIRGTRNFNSSVCQEGRRVVFFLRHPWIIHVASSVDFASVCRFSSFQLSLRFISISFDRSDRQICDFVYSYKYQPKFCSRYRWSWYSVQASVTNFYMKSGSGPSGVEALLLSPFWEGQTINLSPQSHAVSSRFLWNLPNQISGLRARSPPWSMTSRCTGIGRFSWMGCDMRKQNRPTCWHADRSIDWALGIRG